MIRTCMHILLGLETLKPTENFSKYTFMAAYIIMYQKFSSLVMDEKFRVCFFHLLKIFKVIVIKVVSQRDT